MKIYFYIIGMLLLGVDLNAQNIELELIASNLDRPVDITNSGDSRLFIVERKGRIIIVESDGTKLESPFFDIESLIPSLSNNDERGLLGLAFHPNYNENGYFFINYINIDDNTNIVRYTTSEMNPNEADLTTRELIMTIEQPYWNHNGGCLKFGQDGYLYIGMGDGGSGNDPLNKSQDPNSLLGKMLRIDVDNGLPYTIPQDNPFANDDFVQDEIWALGLRNPWRFSFDRETGDMWIGDVGQDEIEEIDFQSASSLGGENYGWRCYEGTDFTNNSSIADCEVNFEAPVYEIQQGGFNGPCSITGGFVYRGTQFSEMYGKYIFADFCSGDFYSIIPDGQNGWTGSEIANFPHAISTFGEDNNGELYVASFSDGSIYHIVGENIVSTENIPLLEKVDVYPNPTTGIAKLDLQSNGRLALDLQLVDMNGKVVITKSIIVNGEHQELIDMDGLVSGSYILQISSENHLLSKQLIVY